LDGPKNSFYSFSCEKKRFFGAQVFHMESKNNITGAPKSFLMVQ
jgi:hypothetical protein